MTMQPLHADIVQEIFKQLYMRYGADWSRHWAGMDASEMAKAWGQELAGLQRHEVEHALQHLPDYPPNAPTFRRIACEAPRPDRFAALPRYAQSRKTYSQQARVAAYMARIAEIHEDDAGADAYRVKCAELVEMARDAGERCLSVTELQQLVLDETAEAHHSITAYNITYRGWRPETLRTPSRPRFDLGELQARIGTKDEKPRDWARMILARAESGSPNVTEFAVKKAAEALESQGEKVDVQGKERTHSRIPQTRSYAMNESRREALERRMREPLTELDAQWVAGQLGEPW